MNIRTLDLFCGCGGSSWGAQAAGAQIVCGIDAWSSAIHAYQQNFGVAAGVNLMLHEDSSSKDIEGLHNIDLILASPECTNHTCAKGAKPRDEESKKTARFVLNFARELEPRWVVIENVVSMRNWHGYMDLIQELESLQYNVHPQIIDAAEFGVPQNRRRLFLLCDREKQPREVEKPSLAKKTVRSHIIDWHGTWKSTPLFSDKRAEATKERAKRAINALGEGEPFLIVYYGSDGSGGWQPLDRPIRTLTTLDRFGLVTWQDGIPMLRMLQPPELKKAMGFDESYVLPDCSRREQLKLLGNGVCPPVMKAIVDTLTGNALELHHKLILTNKKKTQSRKDSIPVLAAI